MKTIKEEFEEYMATVYTEPVSDLQKKECHHAFFAGCLTIFAMMRTAGELPEDQAYVAMQAADKEVTATCAAITKLPTINN